MALRPAEMRQVRLQPVRCGGQVRCDAAIHIKLAELEAVVQTEIEKLLAQCPQEPVAPKLEEDSYTQRLLELDRRAERLMDAFAEGLGDYDKTRKVLILTTQVTYEGSDVGIYEVGKRVKNRFRFLEAHDMTIEAVVTKVMWLLAQNCDSFDQLQQRFYRQVNFDTFYH